MATQEFIKSEIKGYIQFLFPEFSNEEIQEMSDNSSYEIDEENKTILIEIDKRGYAMGWSEEKGIYGLTDENRDFDEKFQEGEE